MAQWLGALAALAEDSFSSQHPHDNSQLPVTPIPLGFLNKMNQEKRLDKVIKMEWP